MVPWLGGLRYQQIILHDALRHGFGWSKHPNSEAILDVLIDTLIGKGQKDGLDFRKKKNLIWKWARRNVVQDTKPRNPMGDDTTSDSDEGTEDALSGAAAETAVKIEPKAPQANPIDKASEIQFSEPPAVSKTPAAEGSIRRPIKEVSKTRSGKILQVKGPAAGAPKRKIPQATEPANKRPKLKNKAPVRG